MLVASKGGTSVAAWDIATGCFLTAYKGGGAVSNGLALVGGDYMVAVQPASSALHFWTWHRGSLLQRCFAAEALTCVAGSEDGGLCAAGAASGRIYLWQTGSGRLLKSWSAHYKPVSVLVFADGGRVLVSGGSDALVHAWLLADVTDAEAPPSVGLSSAAFSWSSHTQAVTSLWAGVGGPTSGFVASASLDHTCRMYSLATGDELASFRLPAPLRCCQGDPQEQAMYLGAADGFIYEVSLFGGGTSGSKGAGGFFTSVATTAHHKLEGHTAAVACLAFTAEGMQLVSGSEDGTVCIWDTATRQPLRVLASPGKGAITALVVVDRPRFLATAHHGGSDSRSSGSGSRADGGPARMAALRPFERYPTEHPPWQGCPVGIDGSASFRDAVGAAGLLGSSLPVQHPVVRGDGLVPLAADHGKGTALESGSISQLQDDIQRLRTELEREKEANKKLAKVNASLNSAVQLAAAQ